MKRLIGKNKRRAHELNVRLFVAWLSASDHFIDVLGPEILHKIKATIVATYKQEAAGSIPDPFAKVRENVPETQLCSDKELSALFLVISTWNCIDAELVVTGLDLNDAQLLSSVAESIASSETKLQTATLWETVVGATKMRRQIIINYLYFLGTPTEYRTYRGRPLQN